jgi:hypothetical protein
VDSQDIKLKVYEHKKMKDKLVSNAQERAESEITLGNVPGNLPVEAQTDFAGTKRTNSRENSPPDKWGMWGIDILKSLKIVAIIVVVGFLFALIISQI